VAYRWAALALRKSGSNKLSPQFVLPADQELGLFELDLDEVPAGPGVYAIRSAGAALYVNQTPNLRDSLARHTEVTGHSLIPEWLTLRPGDRLNYKFLPGLRRPHLLRLRSEQIVQEHPWLNLTDEKGVA
jgi:hypothetical protein